MVAMRWKALNGLGIEYANLVETPAGIDIESVVIGDRFGPCGAAYRIHCSPDWAVRSVEIDVVGGRSLALVGEGNGHWRTAAGDPLPELDGCIDVYISATPLTNTLPIRRLNLAAGERRTIRVAFIPLPSLVPEPVEQAYTCVEPGKTYRYEGIFRKFETELMVDGDGLVVDYPTLFERIV